ncbi:MAG: hypothetical protein ACYSO3_04985 [Planctomycetota bacterium]|jgi:hypothetical protein
MASLYYNKKTKRWRVAWRCKLPDGTVDSGSKSFGKDKKTAQKSKQHCDKNEKRLKRTVFVDPILLSDVMEEWTSFRGQGQYNIFCTRCGYSKSDYFDYAKYDYLLGALWYKDIYHENQADGHDEAIKNHMMEFAI